MGAASLPTHARKAGPPPPGGEADAAARLALAELLLVSDQEGVEIPFRVGSRDLIGQPDARVLRKLPDLFGHVFGCDLLRQAIEDR